MTMKAHKSRSVAKRLLEVAGKRNNPLTPMQVIKLVYLCHGWMLGMHGRPLIRESVEAWRYGPVISDLYYAIRDFRSNPVDLEIPHSDLDRNFDEQESNLIEQVVEKYGGFSGLQLSRLTHAQGTPWQQTWSQLGQNSVISNDLIEDHFKQLYHERQ